MDKLCLSIDIKYDKKRGVESTKKLIRANPEESENVFPFGYPCKIEYRVFISDTIPTSEVLKIDKE